MAAAAEETLTTTAAGEERSDGERRLDEEVRGAHVDRHVLVELLERELVDRLQPKGRRVVDDHVDAPTLGQHALHDRPGCLGLREVGRDRERVPAGLGDVGGHLVQPLAAPAHERDVEPPVGEESSRRPADAGAGSSDDGDALVQAVRRYYDSCAWRSSVRA